MAFEGQQRVVAHHAAAVVGDADEAPAACLNLDEDARGAGVERILQQFLDHGGGAVDDLAGGDLVGHLIGENVDAAHAGFQDTRGEEVNKWFSSGRTGGVATRLRGTTSSPLGVGRSPECVALQGRGAGRQLWTWIGFRR